MKKEIIILFLIIFTNLVSATIEELDDSDINTEEYELYQNEPLKINGKIIILTDDGVNEAYVTVDGIHGTIMFHDFQYINGVSIILLNLKEANVHGNLSAFVNITTYGSCGDGICHDREICCKDCGCKNKDEICLDNQCSKSNDNECTADLQCFDSKSCTIDTCEGVPRQCKHTLIKECINGDECCAPGCAIDEDKDCSATNIECVSHEDCAVNEKCSGITHICYKIETENIPIIIEKTITETEQEKEKYNFEPILVISLEILIIIFLIFGWHYIFK